ncbi:MAG TPA: helix-turn-helix transcriptional regulator [Vicinamibacterales bacterium]|nr:helix-turn-helix transcriptional regulator [Vicinamibacterales bacterium]
MTPQTFGQKLRREREKKRLGLDHLAARTKVGASLLRAMEAGDCSRWPGGIYSRGYIRAYAEAVGLDPEHTVGMFVECYPAFAPPVDPVPEAPADDSPQTPLDKVKSAVAALFRVASESRR